MLLYPDSDSGVFGVTPDTAHESLNSEHETEFIILVITINWEIK
jgi:hypothetical protein